VAEHERANHLLIPTALKALPLQMSLLPRTSGRLGGPPHRHLLGVRERVFVDFPPVESGADGWCACNARPWNAPAPETLTAHTAIEMRKNCTTKRLLARARRHGAAPPRLVPECERPDTRPGD
jgi:hypothetical protein